jgi:hypothetical protein
LQGGSESGNLSSVTLPMLTCTPSKPNDLAKAMDSTFVFELQIPVGDSNLELDLRFGGKRWQYEAATVAATTSVARYK